MAKKHYPVQFKADAVALYRSRPGATIASIGDDLGINRETLRSWVRLDEERRGGGPRPASPAAAAGEAGGTVEQENAELRRRVRELEEERDILRKAARCAAARSRSLSRADPGMSRPTAGTAPSPRRAGPRRTAAEPTPAPREPSPAGCRARRGGQRGSGGRPPPGRARGWRRRRGSASSTGTRCSDATCGHRWAAAARNVRVRATYGGAAPSPPRASKAGGTRSVQGSG